MGDEANTTKGFEDTEQAPAPAAEAEGRAEAEAEGEGEGEGGRGVASSSRTTFSPEGRSGEPVATTSSR